MIHEPTAEVANRHPIEMSASPYNSYYLRHCPVVERQAPYASCLYKIKELEAGRVTNLSPECNVAIERKQCDALGMRDQEKLQGVAMFYYPSTYYRNKTINNLTPESELPVADPGPAKIPYVCPDDRAANSAGRYREYVPLRPAKGEALTPAATPKKSILKLADDGGYAAAINAAMKEAIVAPVIKPEPKPEPAPVVIPRPPATPPPAPVKAHTARPTMLVGETPLQYARRVAASR